MASSSPQYKAVLSHLEALTTTLRIIPGAEDSLLLKFQERLWLAIGAGASAKELVTLALNRIKNDVKDYDVFINMLRYITGMEQVVNTIEGTLTTCISPHSHMHFYSVESPTWMYILYVGIFVLYIKHGSRSIFRSFSKAYL